MHACICKLEGEVEGEGVDLTEEVSVREALIRNVVAGEKGESELGDGEKLRWRGQRHFWSQSAQCFCSQTKAAVWIDQTVGVCSRHNSKSNDR